MTKICILTPRPDYHERWQPVADQYRALFAEQLEFRTWTDAENLSGFAIVMPLLVWGYPVDPRAWFTALDTWEATGVNLANSVSTLRWNTNKDYLIDLDEQGVAIVPTMLATSLDNDDMAAARAKFGGTVVIKPSISGGAEGTFKLGPNDAIPFSVIEREMLIQPMMPAIATEGEYSLFYFNGVLSHTILKKPADGDFRVQPQFGGGEVSVAPPAGAITLAVAALGAMREMPLYARVDMVRDKGENFALMELEMIEPALFFDHSGDHGAAFAAAVRARI